MTTRFEIQMDFEVAKAKAAEIEEIANGMGASKGKLDTNLTNLKGAWNSTYSQNFMTKGATLEELMEKSQNNLMEIAGTIRTIAQNIYNAEMENLRIAEERKVLGK